MDPIESTRDRGRGGGGLWKEKLYYKIYPPPLAAVTLQREKDQCPTMAAIANTCYSCTYSTVSMSQLHKHDLTMPTNHIAALSLWRSPHRASRITSKLPDGGVQRRSPMAAGGDFRSKMDEYNVAMKRLMRNPYEYHHDLGQFHWRSKSRFLLIWFLSIRILYFTGFSVVGIDEW